MRRPGRVRTQRAVQCLGGWAGEYFKRSGSTAAAGLLALAWQCHQRKLPLRAACHCLPLLAFHPLSQLPKRHEPAGRRPCSAIRAFSRRVERTGAKCTWMLCQQVRPHSGSNPTPAGIASGCTPHQQAFTCMHSPLRLVCASLNDAARQAAQPVDGVGAQLVVVKVCKEQAGGEQWARLTRQVGGWAGGWVACSAALSVSLRQARHRAMDPVAGQEQLAHRSCWVSESHSQPAHPCCAAVGNRPPPPSWCVPSAQPAGQAGQGKVTSCTVGLASTAFLREHSPAGTQLRATSSLAKEWRWVAHTCRCPGKHTLRPSFAQPPVPSATRPPAHPLVALAHVPIPRRLHQVPAVRQAAAQHAPLLLQVPPILNAGQQVRAALALQHKGQHVFLAGPAVGSAVLVI